MRTIRLDDYPSGCPGYDIQESRAVLTTILPMFNVYGIPYMLGASPLLMKADDVEFLNREVLASGKVVMHGFDHAFDFHPWDRITETWPKGGEFWNMSAHDVCMAWTFGDRFLRQIQSYDPTHFVPAFNCINQAGLNGLSSRGVRFIHTCDKEYNAYGYKDLDWRGMEPVISPYQTTYHDADKVLDYLKKNPNEQSQITLHWMFDKNRRGWEMDYENLCRWIVANG